MSFCEKNFLYAFQRIKKYRKEAGISQAELAVRLGVTSNYISMLECGRKLPSEELVIKACQILHLPDCYIMDDECSEGNQDIGIEPPSFSYQQLADIEGAMDMMQLVNFAAQVCPAAPDFLDALAFVVDLPLSELTQITTNIPDSKEKQKDVKVLIENADLSGDRLTAACARLLKMKKSLDYLSGHTFSSMKNETRKLLTKQGKRYSGYNIEERPRARDYAAGIVTSYVETATTEGEEYTSRYIYLNETAAMLYSTQEQQQDWTYHALQRIIHARYQEKTLVLLTTDRNTWRQIDRASQSLPHEIKEQFNRIFIQYLDLTNKDNGILWEIDEDW